jgi:glycosidase
MNKQLKILFSLPLIAVYLALGIFMCNVSVAQNTNKQEQKELKMRHVEWSRNANIYEVNIRQYTPEGTINAFRKHLPRLKEMGVKLLWLMPIQPIGEKNRKGTLGSYYSVKDYKAVNPEFGTMEDFKALVKEVHDMGMHIIIDWVANHSAWDNVWTEEHPDFYEKKEDGSFNSPFDWTDVIAFDYNNPAMRDSMCQALEFWVKEADIDGYRCDVAGMVPTDFWNEARTRLDKIKPVFMLAEDEDNVSLVEYAFDMNYTWEMLHLMNDIAKGKKGTDKIWENLAWSEKTFPKDTYRMYFTTNHDENSWNGTTKERLGDGIKAFTVLTYVVPGMPLIYSGQEAGNDKRLRFFDKDTIDWSQLPLEDFFTKLNNLKSENVALWNGIAGGEIININKSDDHKIFACERRKDNDRVVAIINLSPGPQEFTFEDDANTGEFKDLFSGKSVSIEKGQKFLLEPWDYIVLTSK